MMQDEDAEPPITGRVNTAQALRAFGMTSLQHPLPLYVQT